MVWVMPARSPTRVCVGRTSGFSASATLLSSHSFTSSLVAQSFVGIYASLPGTIPEMPTTGVSYPLNLLVVSLAIDLSHLRAAIVTIPVYDRASAAIRDAPVQRCATERVEWNKQVVES